MVGAADAMLKSADIQLASYETTGSGLCTAIIRGSVANVAVAIDAGMQEAERIGELHAVMIIPRLLEDLEHTLPIASYWLDQPEPLPMLMPNKVKEKERELVALPELQKTPLALNKKAEEPLALNKEAEEKEKEET
jgi:carbon dioxide concentrating mechanism protein CcmO